MAETPKGYLQDAVIFLTSLVPIFSLILLIPGNSLGNNNICIGCHSDSNATIWGGIFPVVYTTDGVEYKDCLAGGNFYWVASNGDSKGHNVAGITGPDGRLTKAPGGDMTHQLTCAGTYGCHGGRTPEYDSDGDGIVDDFEAIGGAHHADDACLKAGTLDLDEQGTSVGKSYRFLNGVKGIEDENWEQDHVNTSHNEYLGSSDYLSTSETISALCTQCHPSYHDTGSLPGGDDLVIGTGLSPWLRHPTDITLPGLGEYTAYGGPTNSYSMMTPVARTDLYSILDPSLVEPGKDAVMCLSCHRAHASPYDKLLRWDYKSFMPGEGCSTCHTSKGLAYGRSAHGQPDYGVLRTSLPGYERGGCAHCHEQHASVNGTEPEPVQGQPSGYLLFDDNYQYPSQDKDLCYQCHGPDSYQDGGIINYSYTQSFGGHSSGPETIYEAFNLGGSSHSLSDIQDFIVSKWPSRFKEVSNPCSGCHNPHIAQRVKTDSALESAVTRPLPEETGNVWGDDKEGEEETMNEYVKKAALRYQSPLRADAGYEPGPSGSSIQDGSNLVDYVTFCTDCHNDKNVIFSTQLGRELLPINWDLEKHGKGMATRGIDIDPPFSPTSLGYVVACVDCHEPHGSPNAFLIREGVNGDRLSGTVTGFSASNWRYLCACCHEDDNEYIHHHSNDAPYQKKSCCKCHGGGNDSMGGGNRRRMGGGGPPPINCTNCHFHGSDDSWAPVTTGRRTF